MSHHSTKYEPDGSVTEWESEDGVYWRMTKQTYPERGVSGEEDGKMAPQLDGAIVPSGGSLSPLTGSSSAETPLRQLVRGALWMAAIDTVPIENRIAKIDEWMDLVDFYDLWRVLREDSSVAGSSPAPAPAQGYRTGKAVGPDQPQPDLSCQAGGRWGS